VRICSDFEGGVVRIVHDKPLVSREDAMLANVVITRAENVLDLGGLARIREGSRVETRDTSRNAVAAAKAKAHAAA
jgi:hypothetical protein